MAQILRIDWAKSFCDELGAPRDKHNLWALVAWQAAEGGANGAKFNPLNTTRRMPGSTSFNWVGVQDYLTEKDGLVATRETLEESDPDFNYAPILHHLRAADQAAETLKAVRASVWGTGALALRILPDVKRHWDEYKSVPIGQ